MKRRDFLQKAGLGWAVLGVSEGWLWGLGDRPMIAIAQPAPRKLAVLVGVNQYPLPAPWQLQGALTDVDLQRELLIHRFGFSARDILTLTNEQATREGITSAVINHLGQAGPDDRVVFHFSGYGRFVQGTEGADGVESALVPIDGNPAGAVNDLLTTTLKLLLRSLKTSHILTILDTSYLGLTKQQVGALRVRSYPQTAPAVASVDVRAQHNQLQASLLGNPEKPWSGPWPGVLIAAAPGREPGEVAENGWAFERGWGGFSAGVLTYGLSQYLWSAAGEMGSRLSLVFLSNTMQTGDREHPILTGEDTPPRRGTTAPFDLNLTPSAEGFVQGIAEDGKTLNLRLGGLPAEVLIDYQPNSLLTVETPAGTEIIQIRTVAGLLAQAQYGNPGYLPPVGSLLRESVRVLSHTNRLIVGLGEDLERIERVDATSAFSGIPHVSTVVLAESAQSVDYIFTKGGDEKIQQIPPSLSGKVYGSYGLFSTGLTWIPVTVGDKGEAVKTAIRRLTPALECLWARKLLRLTLNTASSLLAVRVTLLMLAPEERVIVQQEPLRSRRDWAGGSPSATFTVPVGSRLGYRLDNQEEFPLYVMLFGFDQSGTLLKAFRPSHVTLSPKATTLSSPSPSEAYFSPVEQQLVIPPKTTVFLPEAIAPVEWTVCCTPGWSETQAIVSVAPFTQAAKVLKAAEEPTTAPGHTGGINNPGTIAKAVLEDLHQASSPYIAPEWIKPEIYLLSVKAWCSLSFMYQVV